MNPKIYFHYKIKSDIANQFNHSFNTFLFQLNELTNYFGLMFTVVNDLKLIESIENVHFAKNNFERWHNRLFITSIYEKEKDVQHIVILLNDKQNIRFEPTTKDIIPFDLYSNTHVISYIDFSQVALYIILQLVHQYDYLKLSIKQGFAYLNECPIFDFKQSKIYTDVEDDDILLNILMTLSKNIFSAFRTVQYIDLYNVFINGMYSFVKLFLAIDDGLEIALVREEDFRNIMIEFANFIDQIPYEQDDDLQTYKERLYDNAVEVERHFGFSFNCTKQYIVMLSKRSKFSKALKIASNYYDFTSNQTKDKTSILLAKITLGISMLNSLELYQAEQLLNQALLDIDNLVNLEINLKHQLIVQCNYHLAKLYELNFDYKQAKHHIKETIQYIDKSTFENENDHLSYIINTMLLESKIFLRIKNEKDAYDIINQAHEILNSYTYLDSDDIKTLISKTSLQLGHIHALFKDDTKAKHFFEISKTAMMSIYNKDHRKYDFELVQNKLMYAKLHIMREKYEVGYDWALKAENTLNLLRDEDDISCLFYLLDALMLKAESSFESHKDGLALLNYKRLENLIKNHNEHDILQLYPFIALYSSRMGHLYDLSKRHNDKARFYFSQAVSYYQTLDQIINIYAPDHFTAILDFARYEHQQENLEVALSYYETLFNFLLNQDMMDLFWLFNIAEIYTEAGDVAFDLGNDYLALSYYEKALFNYEKLYKINAFEYGSSYIQSLQITASLYQLINENEKALAILDQAIDICDDLFEHDESSAKSHLAMITKEKANNFYAIKDFEHAKKNYEYAIELWKDIQEQDQINTFDIEETIHHLLNIYNYLNDQKGVQDMNKLLKNMKTKENII